GIGFSQVELAGVLASGAVPMLFLFFVGPRMILDGLRLWPAVVENARLLKRCWQPMVFYSLLMALMLAGLTWMPLLLLVFLPACREPARRRGPPGWMSRCATTGRCGSASHPDTRGQALRAMPWCRTCRSRYGRRCRHTAAMVL